LVYPRKESKKININKIIMNNKEFNYTWGSTGFETLTKWIIKDVLPAQSFGICSGPPAGFKTFWAAELAYTVSTGQPFLGYTTYEGLVVYIAAEGQAGIKKRIRALEITNGVAADNLAIIEVPVMISRIEERQKIINSIHQMEQEKNKKVVLIVVDTLARCFDGDENTPKDMGNFIESCDAIKNMTGATILCIHHTGKDDSKGARGHSSLKGACDFEFFIRRKAGSLSYTLKNSKQKDSEEIADTIVNLDVVDLQFTCDEGKPITSLARTVSPTSSDNGERHKQCPYYQLLVKVGRSCTRLEFRNVIKQVISPNFDGAARKRMSTAISRLVELNLISIDKCSSKTDEHVLALIS